MPLYDYRCQTCGDFEAWQSLADFGNPIPCPSCEAIAKRLISAPHINLNSKGLSLRRPETKEPTVMTRDRDPQPSRNQPAHGRPWMISH